MMEAVVGVDDDLPRRDGRTYDELLAEAEAAIACAKATLAAHQRRRDLLLAHRDGCSKQTELKVALTTRQLEVLRYLADGRGTQDIAQELWLSRATVRNHVHAVLHALGAHSRLEAVARARQLGLV
jgi:DNA-binding NarL/FixJ family response regulator